jgi:hypothetical protein
MAFEMRVACPTRRKVMQPSKLLDDALNDGVYMKALSLLFTLAVLVACAGSPTAPSAQSSVRSNLLTVPTGVSEARNPSGTGQPSQSCGSATAQTEPNGFGTPGFAHAETVYAGSDGTPSQANGNSHAVSQYDVACYQLSNK